MTTRPTATVRAATHARLPHDAASELADALGHDLAGALLFVSPRYDRDALASALAVAFPEVAVVGCTTSGQIGPSGFQPDGITAVGFPRSHFQIEAHAIEPLDAMQGAVTEVCEGVEASQPPRGWKTFGLLLVDGLSMAEERLAAALYAGVGGIPIVGGSAGDDLAFEATHVYVDGCFRSNAAVLLIVHTPVAFTTIKVMHHVPTDRRLVITAADPAQRLVREINGYPAATAYAAAVGVAPEELCTETFSRHPVMLRLGNEHYIRSIQCVEADGSMRFYCAIDKGLVLSVAKPSTPLDSLQRAFERAQREIGQPSVVLGCDCILRRLELESLGLADEVGRFFADTRVVGFSTYGEQVDGVHVNQTFAGIALGGMP